MAFKVPSLFENKIDHNTIYWGGKISKDRCNGKISSQYSEAFEIDERRKKISPMINFIFALGFYVKPGCKI